MKKTILLAALVITAFVSCASADGGAFVPTEPTMAVAQIKQGMKAKLRTVLSGTEISEFNVTVAGVLPRKTDPRHLILIKVDDKKIKEHGGLAAGMSGSPVYIGGKLIGAFAYSWSLSDTSLGLVTPIEDMVKAMSWKDNVPKFSKPVDISPEAVSEDSASDDKDAEPEDTVSDDKISVSDDKGTVSDDAAPVSGDKIVSADVAAACANFRPCSMVLAADGISSTALPLLKERLGMNITPYGATSENAGKIDLTKKLKPGSAMGVSLAWGDISIGGIGTLTAVDKHGRFLAFGHPMMGRGSVAMPLTEAEIIQVVPSLEQSFKLGWQGRTIGMVTQDRPQAIGGYFGKLPPAASWRVNFTDADTKRKSVKNFQTVADQFAGPSIGAMGMLSLIENEWARNGQGTAMLTYSFSGGGLKQPWVRRNIFFSSEDILKTLLKEFSDAAKIFSLNQFREISPLGITLDAELTSSPRVVTIEKLEIEDEKKEYKPGDKVKLKLTLRPWRKHAVVKRMTLLVPKNATGICEIDARGGGIEEPGEDALVLGLRSLTSMEELLRELSIVESNNQIIVEIGGPEKKEKASSKDKRKNGSKDIEKSEDAGRGVEDESSDDEEESEDGGSDIDAVPEALKDTRLLSEVRAKRIKEGAFKVIDTNYYVDGILRKFIKIKSDKSDKLHAILAQILSTAEKEKSKKVVPARDEKKNKKKPNDAAAQGAEEFLMQER